MTDILIKYAYNLGFIFVFALLALLLYGSWLAFMDFVESVENFIDCFELKEMDDDELL